MKDLIIRFLGNYVPTLAPDGSAIGGVAGVDFAFVIAGLVLLLFIYCLFRLVGEIFK